MKTTNLSLTLTPSRTRLSLRFFIVLSLALGLLANWRLQWNTGRMSPNAALADNPPTENEIAIPTPNSGTFQVAGGPDGNFWFCEAATDKIGRITPQGVFTEFPLPPGTFPYGIAIGPDKNMWFTGQNANIIGRITLDGAITTFPIPTPNSKPYGITAGPDGNLWFTEAAAGKIGKITPSGSFAEFPLPLTGTLPFMICQGPGDGNVWFTEQAGNFVSRITPTGTITQFPIPTLNSSPSGVTPGPDNRMWFTEYGANKIGTVSRFGVFVEFHIPTPNSFPFGIVSPGDGNLYCTLQGASAIQPILHPFLPLPAFGSIIPTSEGPSGITFLPNAGLSLRVGTSVLPVTALSFHVGVVTKANEFGRFTGIIIPADCILTLDEPDVEFDVRGKKGCIVHGTSKCKPTAFSDFDWIVVDDVQFFPDTMEYNILYDVQPNPTEVSRTGEIDIDNDEYVGVYQASAQVLPGINVDTPFLPSGTNGATIIITEQVMADTENTSWAMTRRLDFQTRNPRFGRSAKARLDNGTSAMSAPLDSPKTFTSNSIVGWNGEGRETTLVSSTRLMAQLTAADLATPGTARVTVFDPSPGGGTSPDFTFTITAAPGFAIGFDSSTVTAQAGTKARVSVNITRTGGFAGNVTVTPPPAANGIKSKPPDPITAAPTETNVVFKFKVGGGVTPGQYPLTFTAQDDSGRTHTATVMLVVQ